MADEDQQGNSGGEAGGQEGADQGNQSDDPGPIGVGTSIRGGNFPGSTRKASLDRDDPGPIGVRDLIEEERPGQER